MHAQQALLNTPQTVLTEGPLRRTSTSTFGDTKPLSGGELKGAGGLKRSHTTLAQGVKRALTPVAIDILSQGVDVAKDYAIQLITKQFDVKSVVKNTILTALNFTVTSLQNLSPWLSAVLEAIAVLKKLADIPKGVVSAVLWAIGKAWYWVAENFYNGRLISKFRGDITESDILGKLTPFETAHTKLQEFADILEEWVEWVKQKQEEMLTKVLSYFGGDKKPEDADTPIEQDDEGSQPKGNLVENKFISLGINPARLGKWDDSKDGAERAGLQTTGRAQFYLIGQTLGGDLALNLPFGKGWEVAVEPVFETSSLGFTKVLYAEKVTGDKLILNDAGLSYFGASIHGLCIANGRVKSEKISLKYNKGDNDVQFNGDATVPLWNSEALEGHFDISLDTSGDFKSGKADVGYTGSIEVIPGYLSIANPKGEVEVKKGENPNFDVSTDVSLENLPGGVHASVSKAKVSYHDAMLGGEIAAADITIPIGKHTTMTLAMTKAKFNKNKITADSAFMDLEHDSSKALNEGEVVGSSLFGDSNIFSSIFDLKQLSLHQGLSSIKYEDGKFTYVEDENNGLQKLHARVLGLEAKYDAKENKGSLMGSWSKEASIPAIDIDIPLVAGVAGGHIGLSGGFEVGANVSLSVEREKEDKDKGETFYQVEGEVGAKAAAKARLTGGVYAGLPYLAKIQGGLYGEVSSGISGKANIAGGLKYTKGQSEHAFGKFGLNEASPVKGGFNISGELKAKAGLSLDAKVLVFSKKIASVTLGEWTLGKYSLIGDITKDDSGKGYKVTISKSRSGFIKKPDYLSEKPPIDISVDKWIEQHVTEGNEIDYEDDALAKRRMTEVLRKTYFGSYETTKQTVLLKQYRKLLKTKYQSKFDKVKKKVDDDKKALVPATSTSFIWTPKVWDYAVERKKFAGFDKSASKKEISALLSKYHKEKDSDNRLLILERLEQRAIRYRDTRSKSEENKHATTDFIKSIKNERKFIR